MTEPQPSPSDFQTGEGDLGARLLGLARAAQRRGPEDRAFREAAGGFRSILGTLPGGRWRLTGRSTGSGVAGDSEAETMILERLARHGLQGLEISWDVTTEGLHRLARALSRHAGGAGGEPFPADTRGVTGLEGGQQPQPPWIGGGSPLASPSSGSEDGDMHRSLDEVLDVGVTALEQAIGGIGGGGFNIDALEGALGAAERAIAHAGEQVSKPVVPNSVPPPDDPEFREYHLSREQLLTQVEGMAASAEGGAVRVDVDTEGEELSILLHTLLDSSSPARTAVVFHRLQRRLRADMPDSSRALVWGAVHDLCERGEWAALDQLLPLYARAQRFSNPPFPVQLGQLTQALSPLGRDTLWPHAANELLQTRREKGERTPREVFELVASLPPERLPAGVARLRGLDALAHGRLASDPFQPRARRLYPLFSRLLSTPDGEKLGPSVLRALRVSPPSEEWKVVLDALWGYRDSYTPALSGLLAFADGLRMPPVLRGLVARAMSDALGDLERRDRREPWVLPAVDWLGRSGAEEALEILLRMTRERAGWLRRRAWPRPVRRAARRALAALRTAGDAA